MHLVFIGRYEIMNFFCFIWHGYLKLLSDNSQDLFSFDYLVCIPSGIYLFKFNNRNTRTMSEICYSKLTIKTSTDFIHFSGVSIVDFEQVYACWYNSYLCSHICFSICSKCCRILKAFNPSTPGVPKRK